MVRGKPINKPWWIFVGPFIQIKRHFCAKKYFLIIKFLLKLIFCWWLHKFIQLAFSLFLLKIKGKIVEACHVSVTRITAQKGTQLLNIYKKNCVLCEKSFWS